MNSTYKYIFLVLLTILLSFCGDADVRLYPSLRFAISFEFGNVPETPGDGDSDDEKRIDIEQVIEAIKNLDIEGTIENVALESMVYEGFVDYEGELEELELSIKLLIGEESHDIVSNINVSLESIRTGEDFNLTGDLNEEGVSLLKESVRLLIEKVVNKESLADFNRSIKVSIDNLPPDEEIYIKITLHYFLAVRYKETVNLL